MIAAKAIVKFDRFRIDSVRRVLLFDGRPVPLQPRAFDIVEFLAANSDRFVSREDIEAHVWNRQIGENNLRVQMSSLRQGLAKCGAAESIVTRPGVGYRFVGELINDAVVETQHEADAQAGMSALPAGATVPQNAAPIMSIKRRGGWPAAGVAAFGLIAMSVVVATAWHVLSGPEPARLSIVVLPFRFLGSDQTASWLADAVTDDLTTELARVPDSTVIARETAEIYKAHAARADEIGRALNVKYLLEGSVAQDANSLHINVQLIDTVRNDQIWAYGFGVPRDQMSSARDLIVGRIAALLNVELVQAVTMHAAQDRPHDVDAVALYFQARSILDREATLDEYTSAQSLLERAIAQQPGFGDALAELGWLLAAKMTEVDDPRAEADYAEARSAIERALQASPESPLALSARGRIYSFDGRYTEAVACAKKALALDPNSEEAQLVLMYAEYYEGHLDEAVAPLEAMLRLDPEGPTSKLHNLRLGFIRMLQGREGDAIELLQKAAAGDTDPDPGAGAFGREDKTRLLLIAAHEMNGEDALARVLYSGYSGTWLHRSVWRIGTLSPKGVTALQPFQGFLAALHKAGMPQFADEHVDENIKPPAFPLAGDSFAATPLRVPLARTIDTAGMQALMHGPAAKLVIDVGTGSAAIAGAVWKDTVNKQAGNDQFLDDVAQPFAAAHPASPIVVMGDGTYGVASYNAALHLVSAGYKNILWYRGGEEAWAKNGLASTYLRSD